MARWRGSPNGGLDGSPSRSESISTRLTPVEVASLVADYQLGLEVVDLVARYGIHEATVHAHLNRNNVKRRPLSKLSAEQVAEAANAYRGGSSCLELGRRYGVGRDTIRRHIKRMGVDMRRR